MQTKTEAFRDWVNTAKVGQVYIYHTGFLAVDRGSIVDRAPNGVEFIPNEDVDNLGWDALSAFEDNRLHLFQRKIHDGVYQYIAMKRGRRNW